MKKKLLALYATVVAIAACSTIALAAGEDIGTNLPMWMIIPFVGMLLCIAIFPLVNGELWEKSKPWVVLLWSLLFLVPFAIMYGGGTMMEHLLESVIGDYLTFIVLLFGLFCVAGNICLEGDLQGKPSTNIKLLLIGTILASWVGTTGASMVMIRPLIRANSWRRNSVQVVVFFIFLVSNMGGALTPIGDPPLLMGFMRGVPFQWELVHLTPILVFNVIIMLIIFFLVDSKAYKKDIASGLTYKSEGIKAKLHGPHNIIFMLLIVFAVILSGVLPGMSAFQDASGEVISLHIYGDVALSIPNIIEIVLILVAALLSFKTTKQEVRDNNHFTWAPIKEVAILFIGIFITMIPALLILKAHGGELGLNQPWQMFWAAGALSSFLDNTPTYLVFLTTAGAEGAATGIATTVGTVPAILLVAISCGAVFMGANTYIGNAPNFMVKSIAEENHIKMPSFFGYMGWAGRYLIPVFIIDTAIIEFVYPAFLSVIGAA
jgi:Na+/H+ antiporter NhaD/arsenite permease-like protein